MMKTRGVIMEVPKSIQNKGYKHYIDFMWENRREFIEEFDLEDYILVICEKVKEVYNFDDWVVKGYMRTKKLINGKREKIN